MEDISDIELESVKIKNKDTGEEILSDKIVKGSNIEIEINTTIENVIYNQNNLKISVISPEEEIITDKIIVTGNSIENNQAQIFIDLNTSDLNIGEYEIKLEYGQENISTTIEITDDIIYGEGWYYVVEDAKLYIEENFTEETYEYLKNDIQVIEVKDTVQSLYAFQFYRYKNLNEIILPNYMAEIRQSAFEECTELRKVTISKGLANVGINAFKDCTSLKEVIISGGITNIEEGAFSNCTSITSINIPEGITNIGPNAFKGCTSLKEVVLSEGITNIELGTFSGCNSLTSINIPKGVSIIGESAFNGCNSLTEVNMPEGIISINKHAFNGCTSLTTIKIPESVTCIQTFAFYRCTGLEKISIPENQTEIQSNAFVMCLNLEKIIIPKEVVNIGTSAFGLCKKLTIYCKSDSVALTYAQDNNIPYTIDDDAPTAGTLTMKIGNDEENKYINDTWTNESVYIELNDGSDEASGHKSTTYSINGGKETTAPQVLENEGIYKIIITTKDNLGNTSTNEYTVKIDKTAPTIGTLSMKIKSKEGDIYTNDVLVNQNIYIEIKDGSDEESGHQATEYTINGIKQTKKEQTLTESGEYNIIVTTTDNAGNIAQKEYIAKIKLTLESLEITTNPSKVQYKAHEDFNPEGMVITVTYSNGNRETIEESEYEIINGKNLTCQSSNIEIQYKQNPEIKTELTVNVEHDMLEATCTENGKCKVEGCDYIEEGSVLGHNYESKVTNPTCTEVGYTTHQCTRCEDNYVDTYIEALDHSFTNYVSDSNATCTEDGTKTAKCERCDETHTITDEGSKVSHNYENEKCTICGQTEPKPEITSKQYIILDLYISKIQPKTTIKEFKERIETNSKEVKVYNNGEEIQTDDEIIKTGMQIEIEFAEKTKTFTLAVDGDVNGDGKADFKDIVSMNKHKLNKKILNEVELIAGDVNNDNKVDFKDIVKVNKYRLNKITQLFEIL